MTVRIGVDTGGTFTDVVLYDAETGAVRTTKTPSTPPEFDRGVLAGIDKILGTTGTAPADVSFLSHGTTVGTNAVLETELPKLGLITNEGLRDVLEIGDQTRPELYDLQTEKPPSLVPRHLRKEVPGRLDSRGEVVDRLDEDAVQTAVDDLVAEGVEAIVVSLLFSYLDDGHERRVCDVIERRAPEMDYARSSAVHPERREYERTITTVLNQSIRSAIERYVADLDGGIEERGIDVPLNVMHSGGGVFGTTQATERAIRTLLSGPAAGAVAAREASHAEGFENAIGIDMGGTSADVSLVTDGDIVRSTEGEINDLPVKTPMIDINTVGAGGGSVAWLDAGGALRVGPRSAGADPGPVCYGEGGEEPTLTDANLILGRINPEYFLGGEMDLATERAREVFRERVGDPLGMSVERAAMEVVTVANASLTRETRRVTVERGTDPATFALVAFGGAGPLQAPAIAAEMDLEAVVVPRSPGVFSATGLLLADVRVDESHAYRNRETDADAVADQFAELQRTVRERFEGQGGLGGTGGISLERALDMRYRGQSYELTVDVPPGRIDGDVVDTCTERFHRTHERRYGHAMPDEPVEVVTLRVTGTATTPRIETRPDPTGTAAKKEGREVYFEGEGFRETDIYDRRALDVGDEVDGPAILEEPGSTAIVPRGTTATVSENGNVIIRQ